MHSKITQSSHKATGAVDSQGVKPTLLLAAMLLFVGCGLTGMIHAQEVAKPVQNGSITSESAPSNNGSVQVGADQVTPNINANKPNAEVGGTAGVNGSIKQSDSAVANPDALRDPNKVFDASIPAAEFVARHPPGSISSVVGADDVLTDVTKARAEVELRNTNERRVCYKKFFTNHCLDAVKEQRRLALKQIRPLEVEANAFKRRATADDRDKALAEQQAKNDISAPKLQQDQKDKESSIADKVKQGGEHDAAVTANTKLHAGEAEKRVSDNAKKLQQIQQNETAKTSERAANRAAFAKKGQDAADRQRDIAEKKAEKARQLAEKKAGAAPTATSPALAPTTTKLPAQP
ncbi:hypothetical protein [Glaciimonas sp. PAMC28666]|uniref:hypothetical protein n=1 Tax=Glaciimonas sp. PAMC28666 TaxID=2807626 RepID=UPI001966850D|nr:hypothetical protein [Glaciimonas sp. PAMC28666]QRX82343.1 hypothetical protein JQN73_20000 [Glaciimonas sp. PAMC28666]